MKKLGRKFWGTFMKNSKHEKLKEFENFVDEFVEISEFENMQELNEIFAMNDFSDRIIIKGFEMHKNSAVVLLQSAENFDKIILTSKEYFSENKIDLLNEIIETFENTTTNKGVEPIYKLVSIEEI